MVTRVVMGYMETGVVLVYSSSTGLQGYRISTCVQV